MRAQTRASQSLDLGRAEGMPFALQTRVSPSERPVRNVEQALRAMEVRQRVLFEYSPLPKWLYDVKTLRFLEVNRAAVRHYGYSRDEFLRMTLLDIRPPDDAEALVRQVEEVKKDLSTTGTAPVSFGVWRHGKKDGTLIDVEITGQMFDFEGSAARLIAVNDISERLRAERALRASDERYRLLLDSTADGIYGIDMHGCCTLANRACARLLGYDSADALLGKHMHSLVHHTKPDGTPYPVEECRIYQAFRLGQGTHVDDEVFWRADGTSFPVEYSSFPITHGDTVIGAAVTFRDVSEKRQAEESTRKLAAERSRLLGQLHLQIERMPLIYILFDADLRVTEWNPAAQRSLGYTREEALGKRPNDFVAASFHAEATRILDRIRAGDMGAHSVNENLTKDGRTITCEWFNTPLMTDDGRFGGLFCLARDVTEQKSLQAQFQQSQKMEAIGSLAGGVAHDFNNLLSVILSCSELLRTDLQGREEREEIDEIINAGQRAADLTRQLLAFSRRQILQPRVVDLNEVVLGMEKMLHRLLREDIQLSVIRSEARAAAYVDPGQMEQVIMNLAVNARDAMPSGGKLTLELAHVDVAPEEAARHAGATTGPHVVLSVTDTGVGMDAATQARIFEPFFTTKEVGKGTGLGLSTVFGIVRQSAGAISVSSAPGNGTTFRIYLPAAVDAVEHPQARAAEPIDLRGRETVLLVEDEDAVRQVARSVLERNGYRVLEAQNGGEALLIAEAEPRIDLLVTDVVMPRVSGPQVAARLRALKPELKVLYVSGYTDNALALRDEELLQKPLTPSALLTKVRDVLDAPPRSTRRTPRC